MTPEQTRQALRALSKALRHHSDQDPDWTEHSWQIALAMHFATEITARARQTKKGLYVLNRAEVYLLADQAAKNALELLRQCSSNPKINIHDKHPLHHSVPALAHGDTPV